MHNNLLNIENLSKVFRIGSILSKNKITAVDNVSFDIDSSEIFTLAGESGSGKTTVARMILGYVEASGGEILYKGQNILNIKKWDQRKEFMREVQAVFQNPFETFNPLRKVEEYLFETAANFRSSNNKEIEQIISNALNSVGLSKEDIKGKYPNEFSGGQLQRISIARTLITDPSLIIADEPVSMVDASLRMSIVNLFKELREKHNVSVLYITHDLSTAYYVSDKIAIMFRGNIVEMGKVEDVLLKPKHPYTKMLLDSMAQADPKKKWEGNLKLDLTENEEYLEVGCKFKIRCPYRMEICNNKEVPNYLLDDTLIRCFLYK